MSHEQGNYANREDPDPEVVSKAKRRKFSTKYKLHILEEHEACIGSGKKGGLVRQEGLYSFHITTWCRQRERGELDGLKPKKRGPKKDVQASEFDRLKRENKRLRQRLEQAELIIEVQKKVSQILGLTETKTREAD